METPGWDNRASTKAIASSIPAGVLKIFGLVTNRRKLATTIGIKVNAVPWAAMAKD